MCLCNSIINKSIYKLVLSLLDSFLQLSCMVTSTGDNSRGSITFAYIHLRTAFNLSFVLTIILLETLII